MCRSSATSHRASSSDGGGAGVGDLLPKDDRELVDHCLVILVADLSLLGPQRLDLVGCREERFSHLNSARLVVDSQARPQSLQCVALRPVEKVAEPDIHAGLVMRVDGLVVLEDLED